MVESGSCRLAGGVVTARRKQKQDLADDDQGAAKSGSKLETRGCSSAMKRHGTRCVAFAAEELAGKERARGAVAANVCSAAPIFADATARPCSAVQRSAAALLGITAAKT